MVLILERGVKNRIYKISTLSIMASFSKMILLVSYNSTSSSSFLLGFATFANSVNVSLWHDRLGHSHQVVLERILRGMALCHEQ